MLIKIKIDNHIKKEKMENINKKIDDSIENPFEIKNNFIPPKDQESMSVKFDNNLDRSGKSLIKNPSVETAGAFPPLATPDFTPREEFDQYNNTIT